MLQRTAEGMFCGAITFAAHSILIAESQSILNISPILLFAVCLLIGAFGGGLHYYNERAGSRRKVSPGQLLAAALTTAILCMGVSMLCFEFYDPSGGSNIGIIGLIAIISLCGFEKLKKWAVGIVFASLESMIKKPENEDPENDG